MTTTDFETHPIGTGKRLAELEGLAFARRRTEYTCPVTDEDAEAAREAFCGHPGPEWASVPPGIRDRWRRVAEAVRDRLSGREMLAEPTYHDGYETGRRDEAQARAAVRDEPQPIDSADVRAPWERIPLNSTLSPERRIRLIIEDEAGDGWDGAYASEFACSETATVALYARPDPDAPIVGAIARVIASGAGARAVLDALRAAGYVIEPAPKAGELRA